MSKYPFVQAKKISYGSERKLSEVRFICIHNTGNNGDLARSNALYFNREDGNQRNAGAHFFIDQLGNVYQTIKLKRTAWSVGGFVTKANGAASYYQKCTNTNSVSIELCDIVRKDPSADMIDAVIDVIAYIRDKCPNAKTVIRHWDVSGKSCPERMTGTNNAHWKAFLAAIGEKKKASPIYPTKNIYYGYQNEQVKRLQKCLNKIMNAKLTVDGSYGPKTLTAVKAFKKKYMGATKPTDRIGPKTRAKIKEMVI